MKLLHFVSTGTCLLALACSSEPTFTDDEGTGASGGNRGTGASGASIGTGASSSGGADDGTGGMGASSAGGGTGGSAPTGGGTAAGGQGTGGAPPEPFCGDGVINGSDECDDGNQATKDGCSGCLVECPLTGFKDPTTHHCYFVAEGFHGAWEPAEDTCMNTTPGTTLAALSTATEYNLVIAEVGGDNQWIGGNDRDSEGTYEWSNGESWVYVDGGFPWGGNQPNSSGDCISLDPHNGGLGMYDRPCGDHYDALCERVPLGQ